MTHTPIPIKNAISVPIRVDALWWPDTSTRVAPPTADFTLLKKTLPTDTAGRPTEDYSNAKPWLGDTIRHEPNDTYTLPSGIHLHWTLPQTLRHGTAIYVLDYPVYNELIQQGVPVALVKALQAQPQALIATVLTATTPPALEALVKALQTQPQADIQKGKVELTLDDLKELLNTLAAGQPTLTAGTFPPLKSIADGNKPLFGVISSDPNAVVLSLTPNLSWDPLFLEIYRPLIMQAAVRMKLPPVPNRWLILRAIGQNAPDTAWVVESDRLSKPQNDGTPLPSFGPTAVPENANTIKNNASAPDAQTYQFLGMTQQAAEWRERNSPDPATVFSPLTAVGYGLPEFAAFYPDCQGVFGLCDSTAVAGTAYTYTVIGWFSDPTIDPASAQYNQTPWSAKGVADRMTDFGWTVDSGLDWKTIDGSLYTAKIAITAAPPADNPADGPLNVQVAIGNTAGEALAAYLANKKSDPIADPAPGLNAETLLDATQAGVLQQALEADGPAVVENALHQMAFEASPGGWVWQIAPPPPAQPGLGSNTPTAPPPLPEGVTQALSALNAAQMQFDRTQAYLSTQRQWLFTDWCRALHLATDASSAQKPAPPNGTTPHNEPINKQILAVAATLLNQTAFAVDDAGMGHPVIKAQPYPERMLAYNAAQALYLAQVAVPAAVTTAQQKVPPELPADYQYVLKRQPAPRFWRPNDPVVLLFDTGGKDLQPAPPYPTDDNLVCPTVVASAAQSYLTLSWSVGPSAGCLEAAVAKANPMPSGPSWRPLSLTWWANYFPCADPNNTTPGTFSGTGPYQPNAYSPTFITANFQPDAAGIELAAKSSAAIETSATEYHGRSLLSDHAARTLHERIAQLVGVNPTQTTTLADADIPAALKPVSALLQGAYNSAAQTLAQTLTGFHDRLLMLRRIPQLNIFDPGYTQAAWHKDSYNDATWDAAAQSFYDEIGKQALASPEPEDRYSPIRAGQCRLQELTLVDAFGRAKTWVLSPSDPDHPTNVFIADSFPDETQPVQNEAATFLLPPRLAQPARLLFGWVAPDGTAEAAGAQSVTTSPICGWLALNWLDESLLVFEKDGTLKGSLPKGGAFALLNPLKPISDSLLQKVVSAAPPTLYDNIAKALLTIEPHAHRQHPARSVLISRPLALARVGLQLEVQGAPAPHQGYEWLATVALDPTTQLAATDPYCPMGKSPTSSFPQRETCGFTQVNFQVRLGDVSMADDGLVAYWTVDASAQLGQYNLLKLDPADTSQEPTLLLTCDPDPSQAAQQALLLFDPRAPVHATSGILPTATLTLPPALYAAAIENMALVFAVGPVLTPGDQLLLPLPTEVQGTWQWLTDSKQTSGTALTGKIDDRAHLTPTPPVLRDGRLQMPHIETKGE